ncbi:MAG: DUF4271 domain-containing protein [Paramuribaculum sp.]|nr:DUF4271 domain-containing protein [Paramuribaculum sp.]
MPVDTLHIASDTVIATPRVADTAVATPVPPRRKSVLTGDTIILTEDYAPWNPAEQAATHTGKVGYYTGIRGIPRRPVPGYDSLVMTLVIGVFLIIAVNLRHYSTFLKTFWSNIFSVRRRQNAFDERATVSEARVMFSLVLLLCLGEGILLYTGLNISDVEGIPTFAGVTLMILVALIYYLWQLGVYRLIGYVFTTRRRALSWFKGFTSSQALLAVMLAPPAMLALFMPALGMVLTGVGLALYVVARLFFIIKGFRIFYHNSFSLVYFILYLCSLEIIPLIFIYKIAGFITFSL